jgi:hypothetical protein
MAETIHIVEGEGAVIELALPLHEAIADRLAKGYIRRVNPDGTPYEEKPVERPALTARKPEWVRYAVAQGMEPDDAEALTKQDLIDKYATEA